MNATRLGSAISRTLQAIIVSALVAGPVSIGCAENTTPQANAHQVPTYPDSDDGFRTQFNAIVQARCSGDTLAGQRLVEQLRLPDSAAWFAQNFDQGDAAKLAERYDRLFLEYTSCLEKTIESVCKVKGSEFVVSHRDARPKPAIRAGDKLSAIRPLRELSLGEEGAGPVVLKNGRFVEPLVPIYQVAPEYPIAVKTKHIEGVVVLRATVNKDGKVKKVELIAGHPLLIDAAIEAVKQWRYKPSTLGGNPIEVDTNVSVEFKLP